MIFFQTSPFWVTIVAYFFLKEPIIAIELISMFICFSAVIVIATQSKTDDETNIDNTDDSNTLLGLMLALIAAIVMAFCAVLNRSLK